MKISKTDIPDILVVEPEVFGDERGFFFECFNQEKWAQQTGRKLNMVQMNHSRSTRGVLRGIHYQILQPQGKLVRAIVGEIYDVAVDLRKGSPTFGAWVGAHLSARNKKMLWVPEGFGHAFLVLSDVAEVNYMTTDFYAPENERCIVWNDPDIAIDWPGIDQPVLSEKDLRGLSLREAEVFVE